MNWTYKNNNFKSVPLDYDPISNENFIVNDKFELMYYFNDTVWFGKYNFNSENYQLKHVHSGKEFWTKGGGIELVVQIFDSTSKALKIKL